MSVESVIAATVDRLQELDKAYYNGKPLVDDAEYDQFKSEAKREYPDHPYFKTVGAPAPRDTPWPMAKHTMPMGSIDNIPVDDVDKYVEQVLENLKKWWNKLGCPQVLCQPKFDGLSVNLEYENGELKRAILRNDGIEGEDIFANVSRMQGTPRVVKSNVTNIRCEIMCLGHDLKAINNFSPDDKYSGPRAAAAGITRRYDGKFSSSLTVVPFDVVAKGETHDSNTWGYLDGDDLSALYSPTCLIASTWNLIECYYLDTLAKRDRLPYGIDGIVVKINELSKRTDNSERPEWIRAAKFPPERKNFQVDDIRWFVGKTGKITPVLHNHLGVQFSEKVVHEVTLHNYSQFIEAALGRQDDVSVSIAGDVIPKFENVVHRIIHGEKFHHPELCPECKTQTEVEGKFLYCRNVKCPAKAKALIEAFVKEVGIEWVGPEVIATLYDKALINNYAHLYSLKEHHLLGLGGFQEAGAKRIIDSIQSKRDLTLPVLVAALGIPGISRQTIEKLGLDSLDELLAIKEIELVAIPGIGEKTAKTLVDGLKTFYPLIGQLLTNGVAIQRAKVTTVENNILGGKSYCFTGDTRVVNPETGKAFDRIQCQETVRRFGGVVKSGVSKKLDVLVAVNAGSSSTKARKARELGVTVISDVEFFTLCFTGKP